MRRENKERKQANAKPKESPKLLKIKKAQKAKIANNRKRDEQFLGDPLPSPKKPRNDRSCISHPSAINIASKTSPSPKKLGKEIGESSNIKSPSSPSSNEHLPPNQDSGEEKRQEENQGEKMDSPEKVELDIVNNDEEKKKQRRQEREKTGKDGEKFIYEQLRKKYLDKNYDLKRENPEDLGCELEKKETGSKIEIIWCNKLKESFKPYDIVLKKEKGQGKKIKFIEVKSTKASKPQEVRFSENQLHLLNEANYPPSNEVKLEYSLFRAYGISENPGYINLSKRFRHIELLQTNEKSSTKKLKNTKNIFDTLFLKIKNNSLKVYWDEDGKIKKKSLPGKEVVDIVEKLEQAKNPSKKKELIKLITSKYDCKGSYLTFFGKNQLNGHEFYRDSHLPKKKSFYRKAYFFIENINECRLCYIKENDTIEKFQIDDAGKFKALLNEIMGDKNYAHISSDQLNKLAKFIKNPTEIIVKDGDPIDQVAEANLFSAIREMKIKI